MADKERRELLTNQPWIDALAINTQPVLANAIAQLRPALDPGLSEQFFSNIAAMLEPIRADTIASFTAALRPITEQSQTRALDQLTAGLALGREAGQRPASPTKRLKDMVADRPLETVIEDVIKRGRGRPRGIHTGIKVHSKEEYRVRIRTRVYDRARNAGVKDLRRYNRSIIAS